VSRPLCFDLIDKIMGEVGELKEIQGNRVNMDKVIAEFSRYGKMLRVWDTLLLGEYRCSEEITESEWDRWDALHFRIEITTQEYIEKYGKPPEPY